MTERTLVPPRLVTITLSHFCEKARWGLERAGVAFQEDRHAPGLHALAVRRRGGRHATPLLATADGSIEGSSQILQWADARAAPGRELYPHDPAARAAVLSLEQEFDDDLGPHVRRVIYYGLLPQRALAMRLMTDGAPRLERLVFPLIYSPLCRMMRASLRIDAAGAQRSADTVLRVLDAVGRRLADGRPYLLGERFGAADIAFAALAAPVAWLPGYAVALPGLETLPAETAAFVRTVRQTPAGEYCLRLYADERGTQAAPALS